MNSKMGSTSQYCYLLLTLAASVMYAFREARKTVRSDVRGWCGHLKKSLKASLVIC